MDYMKGNKINNISTKVVLFHPHIKSYENKSQVDARVPLGVAYEFNYYPADIFFEFSPGIAVIPSPNLVINVGVGARYYFDFKRAVKKLDDAI